MTNFSFASQVAIYLSSASDKEYITLAAIREERDREMLKIGKVMRLTSIAKIETDQFRKREAKDEKITHLEVDITARKEVFKTERKAIQKSLNDHTMNVDNFR